MQGIRHRRLNFTIMSLSLKKFAKNLQTPSLNILNPALTEIQYFVVFGEQATTTM